MVRMKSASESTLFGNENDGSFEGMTSFDAESTSTVITAYIILQVEYTVNIMNKNFIKNGYLNKTHLSTAIISYEFTVFGMTGITG